MPAVESFEDLRAYYAHVGAELPSGELVEAIKLTAVRLERALPPMATHAQGVAAYAELRTDDMTRRLTAKRL